MQRSSGRIRVGLLVNSSPDSDQALNKLVLAALHAKASIPTLIKILKNAEAVLSGDKKAVDFGLQVILQIHIAQPHLNSILLSSLIN